MPGFLLIQTASIGDVILVTPVVQKLHAHFPGEPIDLLVKKGMESLFEGHPCLRHVYTWDKSGHKYRNLLKLIPLIRRNRYSRVINFQRFFSSGLLTVLSGAAYKTGFDKNPLSWLFTERSPHLIHQEPGLHETERNLKLIESFTDDLPEKPALYPREQDIKEIESYQSGDYICIAPASLWFTKQFPKEKWIAFIGKLPSSLLVYLLGSPADFSLCESIIASSANANVMNLSGKLTFLQSAALMKGARMNYVNDSAPMHLASAVNAPVAAVFCSTVPSYGFGPLSDRSFVIETSHDLDCRPCGLHGRKVCPKGHFNCANQILIKQLTDSLPL